MTILLYFGPRDVQRAGPDAGCARCPLRGSGAALSGGATRRAFLLTLRHMAQRGAAPSYAVLPPPPPPGAWQLPHAVDPRLAPQHYPMNNQYRNQLAAPAPRLGREGREEQWQCPSCNLLNWVSRQRCRECRFKQEQCRPGEDLPPPRRRRHRPPSSRARTPSAPPHASRPRGSPPGSGSKDGPAGDQPAVAPSPVRKLAELKAALESLRAAQAPEAVLNPLEEEVTRAQAAVRGSKPIGQRLDAARAALKRTEARAEAAAASVAAAQARHVKIEEDRLDKARELQELESEFALQAGAPQSKVEGLADAVKSALNFPGQEYNIAALRAAYARYLEDPSAAAVQQPAPAQAPATTPGGAASPERVAGTTVAAAPKRPAGSQAAGATSAGEPAAPASSLQLALFQGPPPAPTDMALDGLPEKKKGKKDGGPQVSFA